MDEDEAVAVVAEEMAVIEGALEVEAEEIWGEISKEVNKQI